MEKKFYSRSKKYVILYAIKYKAADWLKSVLLCEPENNGERNER